MKKFCFLLFAAVAMSTALQSCDDEEVLWDGPTIGFNLQFNIYDSNGAKLLDNPDYETIAKGMNMRVEYDGNEYFLNENATESHIHIPFAFEGLYVKDPTKAFYFGYISPGDVDNNYFKLKYTSTTGETVTHDIKVKVYDREKATKEHPQRAKYKYYLDNEQDEDGVFEITLQ